MKKARFGGALVTFVAGVALGAAGPPAASDLAGRFTHSFRNGDISGARFTSIDSVIIVPVDSRRAIFDIQLNFFNGHQCSIGGMARFEGGRLVYRDPELRGIDERTCELRIWRHGARLRWDDDGGTCRDNCGARGSLSEGEMRWSSRRAIPAAEQRRILSDYERDRTLP